MTQSVEIKLESGIGRVEVCISTVKSMAFAKELATPEN